MNINKKVIMTIILVYIFQSKPILWQEEISLFLLFLICGPLQGLQIAKELVREKLVGWFVGVLAILVSRSVSQQKNRKSVAISFFSL